MIRVRGIEIDNARRSIRNGEHCALDVPNVRWRYLMCLILGGGMTAEEICAVVYQHEIDGGVLNPARVLFSVRLKSSYTQLGLKMYSTRAGERHTRYELIPFHFERGSR